MVKYDKLRRLLVQQPLTGHESKLFSVTETKEDTESETRFVRLEEG